METNGALDGDYIYVGEIGSGEHTFKRAAVKQEPAVSIQDVNTVYSIKMYPNPTSGNALVDLGKEYSSVNVKIQDVTGSTISEKTYANTQFCDVELEQMKQGIFFVTVTNNKNEQVTLRWPSIKQHALRSVPLFKLRFLLSYELKKLNT